MGPSGDSGHPGSRRFRQCWTWVPPRGPEAAKQAQFAVLMCAFCSLQLPHTLSCELGQRQQNKL